MSLKIALAGNPNCGKTTLFNALTGSNQFVGNWPGVTVEKKEGKLKKSDGVVITDLPGIYSLSPYTLEEVVARNYLIEERPDAILNIIDGTNLERNLYLTTQLTELGIPVVIAINMMDIVKKNGDKINIEELSRELGCKVVEISALKGTGIKEAADAAVEAAKNGKTVPMHTFSGPVEHTIAHIEEAAVHNMPEEQQRWYAIKLFERDDKVIEKLNLDSAVMAHIDEDIKNVEKELDDDAESIITNERYVYIAELIKGCYKKKSAGQLTTSDKIDKVVTNRFAALPIFAVIMFLVYYISMVTVGTAATDWANDGLFGDGWHLFGIGSADYEDASGAYSDALAAVNGFVTIEPDSDDFEPGTALETLKSYKPEGENPSVQIDVEDEETLEVSQLTVYYKEIPANADKDTTLGITYLDAVKYFEEGGESAFEEPDPASYGVWVPGIPVLIEQGLDAVNCVDWLKGLILDGIVAGVGAVLGFVPQMLVLFILLAILEACGYMARIAFVLDRIFRKFGLSGKSFIPILVGTGCGIPGIMASRTIENERDRRMTMWERGWSFIKKAGTIILLSTIVVWFTSFFGWVDGAFTMLDESQMDCSILANIGKAICWIFAPLGWGDWQATVAAVTGLVAKENIVATMGILYGSGDATVWQTLASSFTAVTGMSFLVFNLLCAPCFAAMGAIKREMNNAKWFWFAIGYECGFAYVIALMINYFGKLFTGALAGAGDIIGLIVAFLILAALIYLLVRPYKESKKLGVKVKVTK